MKLIDFSQGSGDFQLDKKTFEYLQEAYKSLSVIGMLVGTENLTKGSRGYILSGVHDTNASAGAITGSGASYSNGYVYIDGEIYRFIGGLSSGSVILETQIPNLGTPHDSKYTEIVCRFGTGVNSIPFSQLRRVPKLMEASFIDEIRMYGGTDLNNLPLGWYLCDGQNETLDLRGRVPIQYNSTYVQGSDSMDYNFDVPFSEGGSRDHQLQISELPAHKHSTGVFNKFVALGSDVPGDDTLGSVPDSVNDTNEIAITGFTAQNKTDMTEKSIGGNLKHTNMQPYKVVYFIQYKGYVKP